MKVLLTGASGFVGSHVLDRLSALSIPTCLLVRESSSAKFLSGHLDWAEKRLGSIQDPASLAKVVTGVTHVIHCAGATKAASAQGFFEVNQAGTRNLVQALRSGAVQRLVHVSSLAAAGPASRERPSREDEQPHPVSVYGRSKSAGEREVIEGCSADYVIVRPSAVYGPRDGEFLKLFKAVKSHILPLPKAKPLSLVYVLDLAEIIVALLDHPGAARKTVNVASDEVTTAREMARQIAVEMGARTVPLPLPTWALWPVCFLHQVRSWATGSPGVLSLQKYAEMKAEGWVCDTSRMRQELGLQCRVSFRQGIAKTLQWYRENQWL